MYCCVVRRLGGLDVPVRRPGVRCGAAVPRQLEDLNGVEGRAVVLGEPAALSPSMDLAACVRDWRAARGRVMPLGRARREALFSLSGSAQNSGEMVGFWR